MAALVSTPNSMLETVLKKELGDEDAALFLNGAHSTSGDMAAVEGHPVRVWLEASYARLAEKVNSLSKLLRDGATDNWTTKLRVALRKLNATNEAFKVDTEGGTTYLEAARRLIRDCQADVVVFGHTHLPKDVRLEDGKDFPRYLNTGTWADVMELPNDVVADGEAGNTALKGFLDAIRENNFGQYVKRFLSYVEVQVEDRGHGDVTAAALHSFCGSDNAREDPLTNRLGSAENSP